MRSGWDVDLCPRGCRGLAALVGVVHVAVAVVPWAAGCEPAVAAWLSAMVLAGWPAALRAVPGSAKGITRLRNTGSRWRVTLGDGVERPAELLPGSRVVAAFVFCQVRVAGQKLDWWLPAYAVAEGEFRRFKVAVRCRQEERAPALLDSNLSNHEEAARRSTGSRRAN